MWQTSAQSPALPSSIAAIPSTDVPALYKLLQKLEPAMVMQLQTSINLLYAFL